MKIKALCIAALVGVLIMAGCSEQGYYNNNSAGYSQNYGSTGYNQNQNSTMKSNNNISVINENVYIADNVSCTYTAQIVNNNNVAALVTYNVYILDENNVQIGDRAIAQNVQANSTVNVERDVTYTGGIPANFNRSEVSAYAN